jgi:hypothetical protein
MVTASKTSDVFISHSLSDVGVAQDVASSLEAAGLTTFYLGQQETGTADIGDAIWEALSESQALIAIVSPGSATHAMGMVEIGAATAWNKPVFLLIHGPATVQLPFVLQRYPVYPLNRIDEVVGAIRSGFEPLTDVDRGVLAEVYERHAVSADQLSQSASALRDFSLDFNQLTKKQLSGERILTELLRLRKQGRLPRLKMAKSPATE